MKYGSSIRADLSRLSGVKVTRQFGLERVIVLEGTSQVLPLYEIPEDVLNDLLAVLEKRVNDL